MSASWQWAKANPDAAARRIRNLETENAALRSLLREAVTDYELLGGTCDGVESEGYIARVRAALGEEGQS